MRSASGRRHGAPSSHPGAPHGQRIWNFLRLALLLFAPACGSSSKAHLPRVTLEPIVARDLVTVATGSVPDPLIQRIAGARVVLLGESHYVQEHQEFLVALLPHLHAAGVRTLMQEDMHVTAWTGEEYAQGRSDVLPVEIEAFDRTLLEGLRAFNAPLAPEDRIHFVGFDMNHWIGTFSKYAAEFERRFGTVAEIHPLLATVPDSSAYENALRALPAALAADAAALTASLGADRYALLVDLVDVELQSLPLRRLGEGRHPPRELLIRARILGALQQAAGAAIAVNCGGFHAQKQHVAGPDYETVGTWLATHPESYGGDASKLISIAFMGAKGWRKASFDDVNSWWLDVAAQTDRDDLVRIMAETAGPQQLAFLPLSDPTLATGHVEFDWDGEVDYGVLGSAFDGVVLYPNVTVLASLAALGG